MSAEKFKEEPLPAVSRKTVSDFREELWTIPFLAVLAGFRYNEQNYR